MTATTFLTTLVGTSLLAASMVTGCSGSDDQNRYADEQTQPADKPSAIADAPKPGSMDRSVAAERTDNAPGNAAGVMPGETSRLSESDVVGQPVLSQDGEEIGKIAQLVNDGNGENEFAVVEAGEFLGIGHKQVAIDVRHLSLTADGKVQSNVTTKALQSMPEYKAADYEDDSEDEDTE